MTLKIASLSYGSLVFLAYGSASLEPHPNRHPKEREKATPEGRAGWNLARPSKHAFVVQYGVPGSFVSPIMWTLNGNEIRPV